ncbi:FecR protein [Novipirellula aureliae]|uniref:FecR protein n=1 Tax=Novipirellula aureliae TaxID=2527966 RepID=A0A5C6EBY2_9BACT|nr:LamG-like jellyroll fold domain-containing protein [Novipirellula aureliae]TWU45447.1 FecR protein [Novipirellula aureliae]
MDTQRLEQLLDLYFDEGLSPETKAELEELLLGFPQARALFWERASLNAVLRQQGQEAWGQRDGEKELVADRVRFSNPTPTSWLNRQWLTRQKWMSSVIAASLLVAVVGLWRYAFTEVDAPDSFVAQQTGNEGAIADTWVAILRKAVAVDWSDSAEAPVVGEPMASRRIQFESGLVEIQTNRGALIAVEGPADIEIVSDMEMICRNGKMRVDVPPPAHGFLVRTSNVNVVDRGTSFAMNVGEDRDAQVHVIDGLVELVSPTNAVPMRELRKGESIGVAMEGTYQDISPTEEMFPSHEKVLSKIEAAGIRQLRSWTRRRNKIIRDPSCVVYFDFEGSQQNDTVLPNLAEKSGAATDVALDGTIVGCAWTEGRWSGKQALEFKNVFDRVLFSVPGSHRSLTCIASVRLDAMDSPLSALLMSGDDNLGIQWQIARDEQDPTLGRLRLAHRDSSHANSMVDFRTRPIFRPQNLGTWIQLAFVWDGENQTFSQFRDGKLVSVERLKSHEVLLKDGQLELGNWTSNGQRAQSLVRNFNGRMDEFMMFDRALRPDAIQSYQNMEDVLWSNDAGDNAWNNSENWTERIEPLRGDSVRINLEGADRAVFSEGDSRILRSIYVGSSVGEIGELEITGGSLKAVVNPDRHTRAGVKGGEGLITQSGGYVKLNALQIGLDPGSCGVYRLLDGNLSLTRRVNALRGNEPIGSLDIGPKRGIGTFIIRGGALKTRSGVSLGREGGVGTFSVEGAAAEFIHIGSQADLDGFWRQHSRSTLKVMIDDQGVTPLSILRARDDGENDGIGGDVTFEADALLHVGFVGAAQTGSWDIMNWHGTLTDLGLRFADEVDQAVWRFEFVDTDASGGPDTLRVSASDPNVP